MHAHLDKGLSDVRSEVRSFHGGKLQAEHSDDDMVAATVLAELMRALSAGISDRRTASRARRLASAFFGHPTGQQLLIELSFKVSERATLRTMGMAMGWPEDLAGLNPTVVDRLHETQGVEKQ